MFLYPIGIWVVSWGVMFIGLLYQMHATKRTWFDYFFVITGQRAQLILYPLVYWLG